MYKRAKLTNDKARELIIKILRVEPYGYKWQEFITWAVARENLASERLSIFLEWAVNNGFDPIYWSPEKLRTLYPQAFSSPRRRKTKVVKPDITPVDEKECVPMPEHIKPKRKLY